MVWPIPGLSEITRTDDLARSHMQEEFRLRMLASVWISFVAVVVNEQLGQPRQEADQVQAASIKPFANLLLGDRAPPFSTLALTRAI